MRLGLSVLPLGIWGVFLINLDNRSAAAKEPRAENGAADLVQAALDAELKGDADTRTRLLNQAIDADPDFAPARWQSGQVKFDGQWRTSAEVQTLVEYHRRWVDYRELRDSLPGSPADHRTLAEYCREQKLANEERFHWANLLLAEPETRVARERLQMREYRGKLFTHQQIAELKRQAETAEANRRRFQPELTKLFRAAALGSVNDREAALRTIRAIHDPAAVAALIEAVARASESSDAAVEGLHLAAIAALGNMPQHEATRQLLNYAVYSPLETVRQGAAKALRVRPQTDYVPLLMAALTAPVEVHADVFAAPDGTVRMIETFYQDGSEANRQAVRSVNYETDGALRFDPARNNPGDVLNAHLGRAAAIAADTRAWADAANAEAAWLNERVQAVLRITTELPADDEVARWWTNWQEYNELQYAAEAPTYQRYAEESFVYVYEQGTPMTPSGPVGVTQSPPPTGGCCCFEAGTVVWTQSGPVAIENVAVGDMALSQNPETGELDYRAVLRTTVGLPTRVLRLKLPEETIVTTLGHRFWVNGRGWEMAKDIAGGLQLHALEGPLEMRDAVEGEQAPGYNLVVDEFHTYFVGQSRLLVHDMSCPRPVIVALPGSRTVRELTSVDGARRAH